MRKIVLLAASFLLLLTVTGCRPKFACSDDIYSGEPRCNSVSAMYNTKMIGAEDPAEKKIEKDKSPTPSPKADQGVEILKNMTYGTKIPLRVPPKIIRVWIAPWEDSDGDLHQPGYIFSEINAKRGRWLYGEKETSGSQPMLKPIERSDDDSDDQHSKPAQSPKPESRTNKTFDKDQPALKLNTRK